MSRSRLITVLLFVIVYCNAQEEFPYNGVKENSRTSYYLYNAHIHISPHHSIEEGAIYVIDDKIEYIGNQTDIPNNAVSFDVNGAHIYPSFIDLYSDIGMPQVEKAQSSNKPQFLSKRPGAYSWNESLKTDFSAWAEYSATAKEAEKMLDIGVGIVLSQRMDGISRGSAALVQLSSLSHKSLILSNVAHALSFSKGSSTQDYPRSLMGAIALLRQTDYDAKWYSQESSTSNKSLEAWNQLSEKPLIFRTGNKWESLNALELATEWDKELFIVGNHDEYQIIDQPEIQRIKWVLPLHFPKAFDINSTFDLEHSPYHLMKHWELAPYNAQILKTKGVAFSLSAFDLEPKEFFAGLRKLKSTGLSNEDILHALTVQPAEWMGIQNQYGTLEKGKKAHFFITKQSIFDGDEAKVLVHFINGKPNRSIPEFHIPEQGTYELAIADSNYLITLSQSDTPSWLLASDSSSYPIAIQKPRKLSFNISLSGRSYDCTGGYFDEMEGLCFDSLHQSFYWHAKLVEALSMKDSVPTSKDTTQLEVFDPLNHLIFPFQAYGRKERPRASEDALIIKGATIWSNTDKGIYIGDVLIENGKIQKTGNKLNSSKARIITAKGMHLTSGIIDEHSHIAIRRGVNEGTQSCTAEVSIGDVINPDDVNIYRQLAGGVTTVQQLHGSANPIGGRSSIIKLRWGQTAEGMKIENAPKFIKFALGENVKQTNWGDHQTLRYPQTRMGVEQIFEEYFTRAREYSQNDSESQRTDLELSYLSEILNQERHISCHSYQQGEMLMLMDLAERFDIKVNTFTHALEGYKIADRLEEHGAGASTFADWWGYKYEVLDAIPYNASILNNMGVVTAINSDDAEMGRRLNQEAAKTIKYGQVTEEEAWKMISLNPAKLLHLDDRMGSIEQGKDADLVLWSANPLSSYAVVQKTFIDGVRYYDIEESRQMSEEIHREKLRILKKMKKDKGPKEKLKKIEELHYHCDDIEDEMR